MVVITIKKTNISVLWRVYLLCTKSASKRKIKDYYLLYSRSRAIIDNAYVYGALENRQVRKPTPTSLHVTHTYIKYDILLYLLRFKNILEL